MMPITHRICNLGIIEKVSVEEVTEWCSRMVVQKKKDGSVKICGDFTEQNKNCLRESNPTLPPLNVISNIPYKTYKTVADAYQGYHQVLLDDESSKLATIITEGGQFCYKRSLQGLISSGDCGRYGQILEEVPRKHRVVEDTLLHDFSIREAFFHVFNFLTTCLKNGVTLNPTKFKFARKEIEFLGYNIGWEKYCPSEAMLRSIKEFPMRNNLTISDISAWFGLVNQITPFFASSKVMETV